MTKKNKRLAALRRQVDGLDDGLLKTLIQRARVVQKIGRVKAEHGQDVVAAGREREILERLTTANPGPLPNEAVEDIFNAIIANCRLLQKRIRVSYFGPEATYTHQAALKHFGRGAEFLPEKSIADVFDDVESGRADYGVVPIENSTEGVVNHTLDMFMESDLVICAERQDPIAHCLMTAPGGKKIKAIHSHPQALAQCRKWLESHLAGVPVHPAASTADAAAQAALHEGVAAVASPLAAELYRLTIRAQAIQDVKENRTRFLVIGKRLAAPSGSGRDKTSLLVSLRDRVGALHDLLGVFKDARLNLTKIESRPTKRKAWQYVFFIDCLGHISDEKVQKVMEKLKANCLVVKLLGSYPRADY
ncbi:MAG: prephenate dehydratase [Elusimicrobia bacterium]|jgi:chorismate mutase/prephenate dehydratase|nr:prephenate dehydratase [Elusimicrobiota bacterium]MBK7207462.1 prephenate dehydratase [Elusimicrobiota bacterium]MBK7544232.1 prephenate dehydratase [Elusimicrobiota bacterium]MBK7573754.1 prephenate dehydratase [Elusimicrobiota bacterium]MBK7689352.1 prephenate dehydratase [Elusimicrobiota bacterium]